MTWSITVTVNMGIYPLHVVQKAAYALSPTLSILIHPHGNSFQLEVVPTETRIDAMHPSQAYAQTLLTRALNDFALRDRIHLETVGIRELLTQAALREVEL